MEWFAHTLYINLDSRPDRRQWMETQFQALGIAATRMPAQVDNEGAIGCSLSHIACLEYAKAHDFPMVCIMEDDAWIVNPRFMDQLEKVKKVLTTQWDVMLLGANNYHPYEQWTDDFIKVRNAQSAVSYVVQRPYYDRLIENFSQGVYFLAHQPLNKVEFALDMHWKRLQAEDRWYMVLPASITQRPDYSDIEGRMVDYNHLMMSHDKRK
jgi:GR25 family glycosyltransferase involved in LPS biosynthesis